MIDTYTIEVRSSVLKVPIEYSVQVFFGLTIGFSYQIRELVHLCTYDWAQFAKLCADLGWAVRGGEEQ